MSLPNVGLCSVCSARVPAEFFKRNGQVWIRKTCPEHGVNESLVSGDSDAWQAKRDLWAYVPEQPKVCTLKCDTCRANHKPNMLFLDVTNHCNMNCPICIASIKRMGFDYNPPISYFEKIFAHASKWDPKPAVQLFGGEPTCRDDLFEIIKLGRKYGLRMNVTTNGLRLADEEYCKQFCDARVGTRFAFDGFSADIYEKLRHNRPAYEKKIKALENFKKHARHKQAIISCIAPGINDDHIDDIVQYCHDNRDWITELFMIPLAETWDPKVFKEAPPSTLEDLERMFKASFPEGGVEFIPAGLSYMFRIIRPFFRPHNPHSNMLLLAGVHPNCESMTLLISDGKKWKGIGHFIRKPFAQAAAEFAAKCTKLQPRLAKLDPQKFFQRLHGKLIIGADLIWWILRTVKIFSLMQPNPFTFIWRRAAEKLRYRWRKFRGCAGPNRKKNLFLRVALLPFEEQHSVDATRLENCKAVFAYEDENHEIQTIPTCMWPPYRDVVLKTIADRYGAVDKKGNPRTSQIAK